MLTATLLGLVVGLILALTGAGGGILAVPLLVFGTGIGVAEAGPPGGSLGGDPRLAGRAGALPIRVADRGGWHAAVAGRPLGGAPDWSTAAPFAGGALAGMLGGRSLAARVAGPALQKAFAVVSALVALGMLAKALLS